jgi:long-chain acyl-CoA synthetase
MRVMDEAGVGMWGTEVERAGGPEGFLVYRQRPRRVTELLEDAQRWGGRDHLVQGTRRVTFAGMAAAAGQVAAYLASRGLRPGDRMLLLARNSPDWVISLWAALRLGAVVAPGNRWWNETEIAHAAGLLRPAVIVADSDMARRLPPGLGPAVVAMDDIRAVQDAGDPVPALASPQGSEDDPALIIFTAGTTGLPKAAVLAHRSVIANLHNLMVVSRRLPHQFTAERPPEVILQSGPLFHIGGMQALLLAMLGGNTMVFLEGPFDSGQILDLIERERVTIWGAVPTMAIRVLEDPTRPGRDLATVRSISLGGSPVTPEVSARLREAFPSVRRGVSTIYGMTEAGGTVAAASGAMMAEHPETAGRPLPVVELRIENPDDGGAGEIVLRTPAQMLGYWGEDAPGVIDDDGWLHTGDLGRVDDGLLYVTGRAKDVIIRGGENIAAAHVEQVLHEHPAVAAVAVVGLPDADLGETVGAIVQLRAAADTAELAAFAAARLARFEVPARWWLQHEPLPVTDAGKVAKRQLREAWLAQDDPARKATTP